MFYKSVDLDEYSGEYLEIGGQPIRIEASTQMVKMGIQKSVGYLFWE